MISFIIKIVLRNILGKFQTGPVFILGEVFSIALTLYLFKMTGGLVDPERLLETSSNYYEFLLIGEIALLLPLSYFENSMRLFQTYMSSGFVQTLRSNQINPNGLVIKMALAEMWMPVLRLLLVMLAGVYFLDTKLDYPFYLNFLVSQIFTLIAMIILSDCIMAIYESYRRGLKLFYSMNSVLAIIGGAYFPVSYLSPIVKEYIVWLFPQTIALQISRAGLNFNPVRMSYAYAYYSLYIFGLYFLVKILKKYFYNKTVQKKLSHLSFS